MRVYRRGMGGADRDRVAFETARLELARLRVTLAGFGDIPAFTAMAKRSAITLAVMNPAYTSQKKRILTECTENDAEAQDFQDSIWYVFDASLPSCNDAIAEEQEAIDLENQKLSDPKKQVSAAEAARCLVAEQWATAGTIRAVELAVRSAQRAKRSGKPSREGLVFANLGGGFHHAHPDRGKGFCAINDVAVAIGLVVEPEVRLRAAFLDRRFREARRAGGYDRF